MRFNYRHFAALLSITLATLFLSPTTQSAVGEQAKDEALALLKDLIPYRSAKGYGQIPGMIDHLVGKLKAAGFSDEDIVRVPLDIDGEAVSGLIVRYAAQGVSQQRPVAFLAHMDVVDALAENWETKPFEPHIKEGYLYGRGTQDNKFAVALLVTTFAKLKAEGYQPDRDLILAFSGDEESGMRTTRKIIQHPYVRNAEYALNSDAGGGSMTREGKPLAFSMQAAEKVYASFILSTHNSGGHSSAPRAENAIYDLARALLRIEELQFPVQFNEITRSMASSLAEREGGAVAEALHTLLENPSDEQAIALMKDYPQYSNMLWTTCVATMLTAGHAENALPQDAKATVNCRILPDTGGVEHVHSVLSKAVNSNQVTIEQRGQPVESPASPIREDVLAILQAGVAVNYPGITLQPTMSSGGTEGREYRRAGIPTYGAGSLALVRPDDSRAHGSNERIPLQSFYNEMDYWDYVIRRVGGGQ
ncbi:M20/M25/M40 family metallo-hydrolase [Parahaliea sp. F7430]|uniref:M20/M25/M40 family metallo-hydrolase n=1 Tax=Sediminihaliea albiluteola TaxID=2758564 RepID=A0A7W2TWS1_9GAMM|nr:M20/M25/M40 family metallo-hydrolase [Sediminihaliea albiluteola]MBA6413349.1 M20/M25/M40 family metallo-hydrolase [Sediminihaliea albiluteola]